MSNGTEGVAPVRLGVIGAGWFASRRHMPDAEANPGVSLRALCRRDAVSRQKVAERFAVPPERAFEDWREMLDVVELDAVLITTPNALHYEQAKAALERGLHVLIEKPMTLRGSEARELVALARDRERILTVALNPPFWAHCHRIRHMLSTPAMGPLESATLYWTGSAAYVFGRAPAPQDLPGVVPPTMYRANLELNGGGYLIDGGPHLISELIWVTGMRVRRISAIMDSTPIDMRAALSIEMENGALACINAIGDSRFAGRRVRNAFGALNGTITVTGNEFETTIQLHGQEAQRFREADLPAASTPVGNFVDAIQGKAALLSTAEHGAHVVEVVEAAYESARTGCAVTIPPA